MNELRASPTPTLTGGMAQDAPPRWLELAVTALLIVYGIGVAILVWRYLQLPSQGDERNYLRWFDSLRTDGWLVAMQRGHPVGFLGLMRLAGGDRLALTAARAVNLLALGLLGLSLWRLTGALGLSPFSRRLALASFLNLLLAGWGFVFKGIADVLFTLLTLWAVIGLERAIVDRRRDLAMLAGLVWAATWVIRPLAVPYAAAIIVAIVVLILRDADRRRAFALAALPVGVCAAGVLIAQLPALVATGRPAFEKKINERGLWPQRKFLSLLRHDERPFSLVETLRIPIVDWDEVDQYIRDRGETSLPRTNLESWRMDPWRKARQLPINIVFRTNFYLAALLGVLYPLAWFARAPRTRGPSRTGHLTFVTIVLVIYTLLLNVAVSPFFEWRWLLLPCVVAIGAGVLALERLFATNRGRALGLIAVHVAFLGASFVIWMTRALMAATDPPL